MSNTIHEIDAREQQITKVIVFSDRAETHRLVKATLIPGVNEIQLKNVCSNLIHDSLRVEGLGSAVIHDVVVKNLPVLNSDVDTDKVSALRYITGFYGPALKTEKALLKELEDKKTTYETQISTLNKIFGDVGSGVINPPKEGGSFVLDDSTLQGLEKLFSFYGNNAGDIKTKLRSLVDQIEIATEKVQKAEQELNNAKHGQNYNRRSNVAIITIEAQKETEAEIEIVYQVYNAGWSPSYDIRVDTSKPSMNISYYGKIRQHTDEDWNNAPLVLSTAQPCLGGHIPELGTLDAVFYRPKPIIETYHRSGGGGENALFGSTSSVRRSAAPQMATFGAAPAPPLEKMRVAVASEVTQNTLSAEFKILREASIPSGTNDHKVTIGIVNLSPKLVHESVPSKNASAFLTASAVNSSEFAFLAGEAAVFLNNAFVAKTHLKNVSPGERFSTSLGVDTAIRVEYKPAKKYHEEGGYITKHSANVTEQRIMIKNTRSEQPVLLTIKHHIPRSTEEKIKVKLIAPATSPYDPSAELAEAEASPSEGSKLNSSNNLEWTVKINAGEQKELLIKWVVEHPKEETVQFMEKF